MRWLLALAVVLLCATDSRAQQPKLLSTDDWSRVPELQLLLETDHRFCTEMAKPLPMRSPESPKPYLECMRQRGWIRK